VDKEVPILVREEMAQAFFFDVMRLFPVTDNQRNALIAKNQVPTLSMETSEKRYPVLSKVCIYDRKNIASYCHGHKA
jgi:hypothetical protein